MDRRDRPTVGPVTWNEGLVGQKDLPGSDDCPVRLTNRRPNGANS